jgi:large subunit ribosomal protein L32
MMMAVPKKRLGRSDQGHRRAHWKANALTLNICPNCGSPKESHTVCGVCGFYKEGVVSARFGRKSGFAQYQQSQHDHNHDHTGHDHNHNHDVASEAAPVAEAVDQAEVVEQPKPAKKSTKKPADEPATGQDAE